METILIFSGGERPTEAVIEDLPQADLVVAANGGYDFAVALGFRVDVLVGDLDSIEATSYPSHVIVERHAADKDQTDLDLALELAVREEPERLVIVGGAGGRLDHELATGQLLASDRWNSVDELDWFSNRSRAHVVRSRRIVHGDVGATISLIPVGGDALGVMTTGLKWNLDGEDLAFGSTRGVSNVMERPIADIRLSRGCLFVVLPV